MKPQKAQEEKAQEQHTFLQALITTPECFQQYPAWYIEFPWCEINDTFRSPELII